MKKILLFFFKDTISNIIAYVVIIFLFIFYYFIIPDYWMLFSMLTIIFVGIVDVFITQKKK